MIKNEKYDPTTLPIFLHDVCVLKLNDHFKENEFVQPVKLTSKTPYTGAKCFVSGWGLRDVSTKMKYIFVSLIMYQEVDFLGK